MIIIVNLEKVNHIPISIFTCTNNASHRAIYFFVNLILEEHILISIWYSMQNFFWRKRKLGSDDADNNNRMKPPCHGVCSRKKNRWWIWFFAFLEHTPSQKKMRGKQKQGYLVLLRVEVLNTHFHLVIPFHSPFRNLYRPFRTLNTETGKTCLYSFHYVQKSTTECLYFWSSFLSPSSNSKSSKSLRSFAYPDQNRASPQRGVEIVRNCKAHIPSNVIISFTNHQRITPYLRNLYAIKDQYLPRPPKYVSRQRAF